MGIDEEIDRVDSEIEACICQQTDDINRIVPEVMNKTQNGMKPDTVISLENKIKAHNR